MRILILQDDFPPKSFGGAGIVAFNLAKALKKEGHLVFVITAVQDRKDESEVEYEGLKIFRIHSNYHERWSAYRGLYNPLTVSKVKSILTKVKPDVVHAHNIHYHLSYHSLKLAKQSGAKVFLTAHDAMLFHYGKLVEFIGSRNPSCDVKSYRISPWRQLATYKKRYNPFRNIIIRSCLNYTDRIFAVSNALRKALADNGIDNVKVIHNGIDTADWEASNAEIEKFKTKHRLHGKKIVLFGGRLGALKGGEQAVRMLAGVVKKVPNAVLLVLGKQDFYTTHMLELARNLGVNENIVFTGWLAGEELKSAYHASDVVCVLSLYLDPFPTVNLEAMASKKPIVGTCFGGTPELVINGKTGYIVNPYRVSEVSEKVAKLFLNSVEAKRFGSAGYDRLKSDFSLELMTQRYLEFYGL